MTPNLPDRPDAAIPPERILSNQDFEMVIRRAAELQARDAEAKDGEGMSEAEVVRIGRELGLSTRHLNQALAEVGGVSGQESGAFVRLYGPTHVSASRTVVGETPDVARRLERYFVEREYLAVLRRLPDRVVLTRATGVAATVGRSVSHVFSRSPLLKVSNLEMAVHPLEEGYSYVTLSTSLRGNRMATAAGTMLGGGSGAVATGAVLAIAIAPPAALLGLPVLGGALAIGHFYYKGLVQETQVQFESLLDRLEHRELPPPVTRWSGPRR